MRLKNILTMIIKYFVDNNICKDKMRIVVNALIQRNIEIECSQILDLIIKKNRIDMIDLVDWKNT